VPGCYSTPPPCSSEIGIIAEEEREMVMSNLACIETCEFVSTKDGSKDLGVRVFDDYEKDYCNTWDSIPEEDLDILRECVKGGVGEDILSFALENEQGIEINGTFYEFEEVKGILEGA
jgi:hypothetical protein